MPKNDELTVITKTYDLILWSCHHTSRFPRNHRFVLGERNEQDLYESLEELIPARWRRERGALLENANLKLDILRSQMRLAKVLRCIKLSSYEFVTQAMQEMGRLMGDHVRRGTMRGQILPCQSS